MIKKILLKIAYLINKKYKTIEIQFADYIKFKNDYYIIVEMSVVQKTGYINILEFKAHSLY